MVKIFLTSLLFIIGLVSVVAGQPTSFKTRIYHESHDSLDLVLYKYSVRADTLHVITYDGTNFTDYTEEPSRVYRGYFTNEPNFKVVAVWYPNDTMRLKVFIGKRDYFGGEYPISTLNIDTLNLPGVAAPQKSDYHFTSGFITTYEDLTKRVDNDIDMAVAMYEYALCIQDMHTVRDAGLSWELNTLILPTDSSVTSQNLPGPGSIPGIPTTRTWFKVFGSGGGAGPNNYCSDFRGGKVSIGQAGFGSLSHEFGHTFFMGHYHNQIDAMGGTRNYFGRENATKVRAKLASHAPCNEEVSNYTDALHPHTAEDYATTGYGEAVLIDVLSNDVDYNIGEVLSIKNFEATSLYGGSITQVGNKLEYTPPTNFRGRDEFTYWAHSGDTSNQTYYWNSAKVYVDTREPDLALHYTFDETTGSTVYDQAWGIRQHHAMLHKGFIDSTTRKPGIVGNAFQISEGTGLRLYDVLDPMDESLTVSAWFKLDSIASKTLIFDSGNRGSRNHAGLSIMIYGDEIRFMASYDDRNLVADRYKTVNWQTNQWYHVALVIDKTQNKIFGYLDGQEVGNSRFQQNLQPDGFLRGYPGHTNRAATTFGMRTRPWHDENTRDNLFGLIDEVKIYTKALSASEISNENANPQSVTWECPEGLFDEPIRNGSFEKTQVKPREAERIRGDWFTTGSYHQGGRAMWQDFAAEDIPNAPDGEQWCMIRRRNGGIYQQIGVWKENMDFDVSFYYGKHNFLNEDMEVSLWVGGTTYPRNGYRIDHIGAVKIDSAIVSATDLNSTGPDTTYKVINFQTGLGNYDCEPLWISFRQAKSNFGPRETLIDDIQITDNTTIGVNENERTQQSLDAKLYPNPTSTLLNIETAKELKGADVYNFVGEKVLSSKTPTLNVSGLADGVYYINIQFSDDDRIVSKKFIKVSTY